MKKFLPSAIFIFFLLSAVNLSAQQGLLTVESIMQDPKWMGTFPSEVRWDEQGEYIYFIYNKDQDAEDSLYRIGIKSKQLEKISWEGRSEEHTSELQSRENLVCRLLLEKKKKK